MEADFFLDLFKYYDKEFTIPKIEIDENGNYGTNYRGLNLDMYLENSIFCVEYIDIDDYFKNLAQVNYSETQTLVEQYSMLSDEKKIKVIEIILTLILKSSYDKVKAQSIYSLTKNYLNRYGLMLMNQELGVKVQNNKKIDEGSYSEIFSFNEVYYKKKLKAAYSSNEQWIKRFRNEFQNMEDLSSCPYVLNVQKYDEKEHSYIMEKCDSNFYDYLLTNKELNNEELLKLIHQILIAMKEVHDNGIIHRDLHLGNILVRKHQIVLCDFGLSKNTMIKLSLESSKTPKNSHYFIAPEGLSDFRSLDKTSDIYSIGKIIDYITGKRNLNKLLEYVINKATQREKTKRYQNVEHIINDINIITQKISLENQIILVEESIKKSAYTPFVEEYIKQLLDEEALSVYIVEKQLYSFWEVIISFDIVDQERILNQLYQQYEIATGYNEWGNYDIFAGIAYNTIMNSKIAEIQKIAFNILCGCAKYRYQASDLVKDIKTLYPTL